MEEATTHDAEIEEEEKVENEDEDEGGDAEEEEDYDVVSQAAAPPAKKCKTLRSAKAPAGPAAKAAADVAKAAKRVAPRPLRQSPWATRMTAAWPRRIRRKP